MLKIRQYKERVLRQKAKPVEKITEATRKLVQDMIPTMHIANGVGLAAPQVGVSEQVIIVNETQEKGKEIVLINPVIVRRHGRMESAEGCLSVPGAQVKLKRWKEVEVSYTDLNGEKRNLKAAELLARILQHEIDHLNGTLIIDHLGLWKRLAVLRKLKSPPEGASKK